MNHSEETKKKIQESLKKYYSLPKNKQKCSKSIRGSMTEERKRKIGERAKKQWQRKEYREIVINAIKKRYEDPAYVEELRKKWESDENKIKISLRMGFKKI